MVVSLVKAPWGEQAVTSTIVVVWNYWRVFSTYCVPKESSRVFVISLLFFFGCDSLNDEYLCIVWNLRNKYKNSLRTDKHGCRGEVPDERRCFTWVTQTWFALPLICINVDLQNGYNIFAYEEAFSSSSLFCCSIFLLFCEAEAEAHTVALTGRRPIETMACRLWNG